MLTERYLNGNLDELLSGVELFKPYPDITERSIWDKLSEELKEKYIKLGEQ